MSNIKIKIRVGNSEIEAEGAKADVDDLIKHWWERLAESRDSEPANASGSTADDSKDAPNTPVRSKRPTARRSSSSKSSSKNSTNGDSTSSAFDVNGLANRIKSDPSFHIHEANILHGTDLFNKILLICLHANAPLTTGDIHRTLTALGVKAALSSISGQVGAKGGLFLNDTPRKSGSTPTYELTSVAKANFQKVLDGKA